MVWQGETFLQSDRATVVFTYTSSDGEEGYPGELQTTVAYTFYDDGELSITYEAKANEPTPVNLTNHTILNLKGREHRSKPWNWSFIARSIYR